MNDAITWPDVKPGVYDALERQVQKEARYAHFELVDLEIAHLSIPNRQMAVVALLKCHGAHSRAGAPEKTLRIRVQRDPNYVEQCYAIAEYWNGRQWTSIYTLHGSDMATVNQDGLNSGKTQLRETDFAPVVSDIVRLMEKARLVVQ